MNTKDIKIPKDCLNKEHCTRRPQAFDNLYWIRAKRIRSDRRNFFILRNIPQDVQVKFAGTMNNSIFLCKFFIEHLCNLLKVFWNLTENLRYSCLLKIHQWVKAKILWLLVKIFIRRYPKNIPWFNMWTFPHYWKRFFRGCSSLHSRNSKSSK